ncbi:MAG: EAL domain-containing protein [Campylobacterota bacterium]|nr:EAL domain-containing protein [Campylobacterota bacterium]
MMEHNVELLKNITVLYAEDEKPLRDVTTHILKGFTKMQHIAFDGQEGLDLFKKYKDDIDIVITDVNMPKLNGLQMTKAIKEINPHIPVIVATAFSNTEYLLEAINLGVDKYVLKPVDIKKLLQVMSQSLLYHELKELYTDSLTGLSNRNRLKKDLDQTPEDLMALINIDKFSTINDLYGEVNGDKILKNFSRQLKKSFSQDDYDLYRVEGDKFAVIAKNYLKDMNQFKEECRQFSDIVHTMYLDIEGNEVDINITIGLAKSKNSDAYIHTQRVINYARKRFETIMVYDESFNIKESFQENIIWVKKIKNALDKDQFKAYFQPIVDTQTKEVYKYEALIRYIEEDGSATSPYKFLEIAKKAKLYSFIIRVMIKEALHLIRTKNKRVAVNISFDDIASKDTVEYIQELLEANKDIIDKLEFEILESEEIGDFDAVQRFITMVKALGCKVGVDDFGAGYSNFNMLVNLEIDFVKIDASLIKHIDENKDYEIIVGTIVDFTKKFGFDTVAEFVSSQSIYDKVSELGISYSQGYYFAPPISYDEVE